MEGLLAGLYSSVKSRHYFAGGYKKGARHDSDLLADRREED